VVKLTDDVLQETVAEWQRCGSQSAAARSLGIAKSTMFDRIAAAREAGLVNEILEAAHSGNVEDHRNLTHFWKKVEDKEAGVSHSLFIKNPASDDSREFIELVRECIEEAKPNAPKYPKRKKEPKGDRLLVIDLADVHFGKLCVKTETGYEYNFEVARHRVVEGTRALLAEVDHKQVGRILFVLGNDILHIDGAAKTTTSGTRQDTEGNPFEMGRHACNAICEAIELCAKIADVDLIHCMSNHDWCHGWWLSQTVAAKLTNHPNVHASEYNLSELHRKYYRFGNCLIGATHGDGAKEEKLYGLMVSEARQHLSECKNTYFLLHHVHHKDRKTRGSDKPMLREKDHGSMTAIIRGEPSMEGQHLNIEYVRSPSPPDGWHDRNGFVNRQAVEAFVFDAQDGMKQRTTEWF
jgi:hypothetical protein